MQARPPSVLGLYAPCGSPLDKAETYSGLTANGEYTFSVRGKDPSGNVDATPASRSWTVDTVAPVPSISGGPAQGTTVASSSASFTVGVNEQAALTCTLDGSSQACAAGPRSYPGPLAQGSHTFTVTATDTAGNTIA